MNGKRLRCDTYHRQSFKKEIENRIRSSNGTKKDFAKVSIMFNEILACNLCLLVSLMLTNFAIRFSKTRNIFIDSPTELKPQKIHKAAIPRIGGGVIFLSFFLVSLFFKHKLSLILSLVSLPLVIIGIWEDYRRTSYKTRLSFMVFSAVLSILFLKTVVTDIGLFTLPYFFAIPFTIFALAGVINSFNIIDGLNGLSSGIALISLSVFALVANKYGLSAIQDLSLLLVFATIGFFVFNFPSGRIFLGDSGSYFLGFALAVLSIRLVIGSNSKISPWFPLVVLFFPIWETVFSIYRRKMKKKSPFFPDKLHTHQLIFLLFRSNARASMAILTFQALNCLVAYFIHHSTFYLVLFFLFLVVIHISIYRFLLKTLVKKLLNLKM